MQLEKLNFTELETLVGWARNEGWNPGPHDARAFWATDPNGFWGYRKDNRLIAGGSLVSYGGAFGFMGLFIVHPDYRAKGVGRALWYQRRDALLARLTKGASIGMDGVLAMQPFYAKGGFEIAYRDERHEKTGCPFDPHPNISVIRELDFDAVAAFDQRCLGFARPQFLRAWLQLPDSRFFKYVSEGKLQGYAVLRKVHTGYKIGPLFAEERAIAEALYKACLNSAISEPVYLDIPMANPEAIALTRKFQTKYVFECARMYYGRAPNAEISRIFGITTFELG